MALEPSCSESVEDQELKPQRIDQELKPQRIDPFPLPKSSPTGPAQGVKVLAELAEFSKTIKHQKKIHIFALGPHLGPKKLQDGRRWPQDGPKMAQDGPKVAQDGPRWPQDGPKMIQVGPKMA